MSRFTRNYFLLFFLARMVVSAAPVAIPPDWENEQVNQINRERPRATFVPFADVAQARKGDRTASPWFLSLNGDWRFRWVPRPEERTVDFFRTDFDDSSWKTFPVP